MPRTRAIEASLARGEKITDNDLDFFIQTISDTQYMAQFADTHEEYQELVARLSLHYGSMVSRAVENEPGLPQATHRSLHKQ